MNVPLCRIAAKMLLGLFWLGGSAVLVAATAAGQDNLVTLPPLSVSANVPLVKVADFKLREPRAHVAAVTDGRYIYVIGGMGRIGPLASIERFDPKTGTSEQFARLRRARFWHGAVFRGGKIYVMGGVSEGRQVEDTVEIVDLATREVAAGASMPVPKQQFGCVVLGDELYVLGGVETFLTVGAGAEMTNSVRIYSFATGAWRKGRPLSVPRVTGAAVFDHPMDVPMVASTGSDGPHLRSAMFGGPWIIVPGGYNGSPRAEMEVFYPRAQAWFTLPPLCSAVSAYSSVVMGHELFLFGDYQHPDELFAYNLFTKKSEAYTLQYKASRHTAAVIVDGKIYVIGGRATAESPPLDYIQVFAPTPQAARELTDAGDYHP